MFLIWQCYSWYQGTQTAASFQCGLEQEKAQQQTHFGHTVHQIQWYLRCQWQRDAVFSLWQALICESQHVPLGFWRKALHPLQIATLFSRAVCHQVTMSPELSTMNWMSSDPPSHKIMHSSTPSSSGRGICMVRLQQTLKKQISLLGGFLTFMDISQRSSSAVAVHFQVVPVYCAEPSVNQACFLSLSQLIVENSLKKPQMQARRIRESSRSKL